MLRDCIQYSCALKLAADVTLSGDTERTRLNNGTDKVIECIVYRHSKDGTALDLTDKDGVVTRKWEWTLSPGVLAVHCAFTDVLSLCCDHSLSPFSVRCDHSHCADILLILLVTSGEIKDDKSDYDVVFESYYYTARVTAEGRFIAGFRIHGGPWSWSGPWLEVVEETVMARGWC